MATWTPRSLSIQPALWLDAESVDSSPVSLWPDRSGNDRHAIQPDPGAQPDMVVVSGRKWVSYNGATFNVAPPVFFNKAHFSIFIVFEPNGENQRIIDTRGKGGFGSVQGVQIKSSSSTSDVISVEDGAGLYVSAGNYTADSTTILAATYESGQQIITRYDGSDFVAPLYRDSVSRPGMITDSDDMFIGADIGGSQDQNFQGKIAEIILFYERLDYSQISKIEGYLAHKWGLSYLLDQSHLYRDQPPQTEPTNSQASKVEGVIEISGVPVDRVVRAFSYSSSVHDLDGDLVNVSKSLGHAKSDPITGKYTIDLHSGYSKEVFVVTFDEYGSQFVPNLSLAVGDRVHPATPNGHVYECDGAGTLPATEPVWGTDIQVSQVHGTASLIARPFYRPMVHGPVTPEIVTDDPAP